METSILNEKNSPLGVRGKLAKLIKSMYMMVYYLYSRIEKNIYLTFFSAQPSITSVLFHVSQDLMGQIMRIFNLRFLPVVLHCADTSTL